MSNPASPLDADADGVLDPIGPPLRRDAGPGAAAPILGPVPVPSRREEPGDASRYRRPERPAPASGDPRGGDDPFAGAMETSLAAPPTAATRAITEPLAALAAAFQANAEALRRSQEMQAELGRALQRSDRGEVMVQTTGALNETFKGLTTVQRSLVSRIDASERHAREGRWFLPILVLGAMAVVGAAMWLVVRRVGELESGVVGTGDTATQLSAQFDKGVEQGRRDSAAAFEAERQALLGRVERVEAELRAAIAERDDKVAAAKQADQDLAGLRAEVVQGRSDGLRARALESELSRLRTEAAVRDPEIERLKRDLADEKQASAALRKRYADIASGRVTADPDPSAVPTPDAAAAPAAAGMPDRRDLERARLALNELLQNSAASGGEYLQFTKIGNANADRMTEVLATSYGANGRVLNFVKARQARVLIDRALRRVEIVFDDGSLETGGTSVPFRDGFRRIVAEGDAVARWSSSGLVFVRSR